MLTSKLLLPLLLPLAAIALLTACPDGGSDAGDGPDEGEGEEGEGEEGEGEEGEGEEGEGEEGEGEEGEGEGEGPVGEGEGEGEGPVGEGEGEGDVDCSDRDQRPGDACTTGIGACERSGILQCAGPDVIVCTAVPGPPASNRDVTDDDIDDDCDGAVDEDTCLVDPARGSACAAGVGACEAAGTQECVANVLTCNAVPTAPLATDDDTADTIDDDCDGVVDEDVLPCTLQPQFEDACTNGVGACARAGSFVCTPDGENVACDAVAGTPTNTTDATLNGIDDDCDGVTDEDAVYPDRDACDPGSECCFDNVYVVPREGFFHVDAGGEAGAPVCDPALGPANPTNCRREECTDTFNQLVWRSNPPASGPHYGCTWGRWDQLYDEAEPLPKGYYVHNVEHGGAVFLYGPTATDEARTELLAAFDSLSILERCANAPIAPLASSLAVATFDPSLPTPVAVVVIDRVLLPDASGVIPRAAAIEFAEACRDNGPEQACFNAGPIP